MAWFTCLLVCCTVTFPPCQTPPAPTSSIPFIIDWQPKRPELDQSPWKKHHTLDLDGDGQADAVIETAHGRGPLSTYYTTYRLRAFPGTHFLLEGKPLPKGTTIRATDLLKPIDQITLCTVGGSLRFPHTSFEEFSSGTWWKQDKQPLAIALIRGDEVHIGYSLLSVTALGEVTAQPGKFAVLKPVQIELNRDGCRCLPPPSLPSPLGGVFCVSMRRWFDAGLA